MKQHLDRTISGSQLPSAGGKGLPQVGTYTPNFKGITGPIISTAGSNVVRAKMSYAEMLLRQGHQFLDDQIRQYNEMEIAEEISNTTKTLNEIDNAYWEENVSGKGYTEYITGQFEELANSSLDRASNPEVRNALQRLYTARGANLANSAFLKERETYTAYVFQQQEPIINGILNEARNHPEQSKQLQLEINQALNPVLMQVAGPERARIAKETNDKLTYWTALGQIEKNPEFGLAALDHPRFKQLTPKQQTTLKNLAQARINDQIREAHRREVETRIAFNMVRTNVMGNFMLRMALGESVKEAEIMASPLDDAHKAQLINHLRKEVHGQEDRMSDVVSYYEERKEDGKIGDGIANQKEITPGEKKAYWNYMWQKAKQQAELDGKKLTMEDFINQNKQFPNVLTEKNDLMVNTERDYLLHSTDAEQILEGARVIVDNYEQEFMKGIDENTYYTAISVLGEANASGKLNGVVAARNSAYLNLQNNGDIRRKTFNDSPYGAATPVREEAYRDMMNRHGLIKYWDSPTGLYVQRELEKIHKKMWLLSGNETDAETNTINAVMTKLRPTIVNGVEEWMWNAPNKIRQLQAFDMAEYGREKIQRYYKSKHGINLVRENIVVQPIVGQENKYAFYYRTGDDETRAVSRYGEKRASSVRAHYELLRNDEDPEAMWTIEFTPEGYSRYLKNVAKEHALYPKDEMLYTPEMEHNQQLEVKKTKQVLARRKIKNALDALDKNRGFME